MADIISPQSLTPPSIPSTPGDISSLVSKDTIKNLKSSLNPKTFGDQIKNIDTQKVISATSQSKISKLYQEKAFLIQKGIKLDIEHQKTLLLLEQKRTPSQQIIDGNVTDIPPQLSEEQYQIALTIEEGGVLPNGEQVKGNYPTEKENLQKLRDSNQKAIDDILNDPFKEQKEKQKEFKEKIKKSKKLTKEERKKARKEKTKAILKNAKKTLVPIVTLYLTDRISKIIEQNNFLKKLVDDTNKIIKEANLSNDPVKLQNAKLIRDNAIKILDSNERKINKIKEELQKISTYITIFSTIVTIISSIPVPTAVPPGVGIPLTIIMKLVELLNKANRIILSLSSYLPVLVLALEKIINILKNYKSQLLNINGILDAAAVASNSNLTPLENNFEKYKGYEFFIKEDNTSRLAARGIKRRYAVAVKNGREEFKSDFSFTLDPNDLVEQLKLIIDGRQQATNNIQTELLPTLPSEEDIAYQTQKSIQSEIDFLKNQQSSLSEDIEDATSQSLSKRQRRKQRREKRREERRERREKAREARAQRNG